MYQENQNNNEEILARLKKRRNLYTLLWVGCFLGLFTAMIPGIIGEALSYLFIIGMGICAGCGMFCINNYRYIKSCGAKKGGGLWWIALLIFGFIIIPIVVAFLLSKVRILGELVIGVKRQR